MPLAFRAGPLALRAGPLARPLRTALVLALCLPLGACLYTRAPSNSSRSATEQLLLTNSVWRAVGALELPEVGGRRVALEVKAIAGGDAAYLEAVLTERLRERGARIVAAEAADLVLVAFVETLGTAARGVEFGIPPIPFGGVATPGLPLVRIVKQRGYTGVRTLLRDAEERVLSRGLPVMGRASFEVYSIAFLALRRNDIYPGEELTLDVD